MALTVSVTIQGDDTSRQYQFAAAPRKGDRLTLDDAVTRYEVLDSTVIHNARQKDGEHPGILVNIVVRRL